MINSTLGITIRNSRPNDSTLFNLPKKCDGTKQLWFHLKSKHNKINRLNRKLVTTMAAKGAHITQNIETRPSIFEVVAADSLNATFYPALKRVANVRH